VKNPPQFIDTLAWPFGDKKHYILVFDTTYASILNF